MGSVPYSSDPRVRELFARFVEEHSHHGVELDPRELCREDPELLEPLLERIAEYRLNVLKTPPAPPSGEGSRVPTEPDSLVSPEAPTIDSPPAWLGPGVVLGERYRIRSRLGSGGMGEVWLAVDLKLRVELALKAVSAARSRKPGFAEGLRAEVRAARSVISPNVCRIYDLVEVGERELVSMEYVDGQTLRQVLRERAPLPLEGAADLAAQLLAGLEAIHGAGLVHRDIKPENIMVTRTGRVVVMDLGLAKPLAEGGTVTIAGTPAYMAPEQQRGAAVDARTDVYAAGIVLAEMVYPAGVADRESHQSLLTGLRQEPPQIAETPWAPVLRRAVARAPEDRYPSAQALARALERVTLGASNASEVSPYPGLSSFGEADAEYFFGREAEVEALWKKLLQPPRLLAVVGPSGAGKSSFLRAGILAVRPERWSAIVVTPGAAPLVALGQAVARELAGDRDAVEQLVRFTEPDVAVELLGRWQAQQGHALLVVDQFEELFTQNPPEVQTAFAGLLGRLPLEADVHVVLGMRDDFLFACSPHEPLAPLFSELTPLEAPKGPALRRALTQPALKCGYRFEDDALVDSMLAEVEGERGALPLLAFATATLWERRDRGEGLLTREAYREIGGVAGSLARHAEATLERIGGDRLPLVRELFRNLVTAQGTRASRRVEELASVAEDREAARAVLATLVDARLLTSYEAAGATDKAEPEQRLEIVHESLLSAWPRLVRWRTQDADAAQMRDQVHQAAQLWHERANPEELLWTGAAYREFSVWRESYPGRLTDIEQAFAEAMIAHANRRRRRRRLAVAAAFALLLAVLVVVGGFWRQSELARTQAEEEARRAEASKLLALGRLELESDPTAALGYATASLDLADSAPARTFALEALWRGPTRFRLVPGGMARSGAFSSDGRWLAAGLKAGRILLWSRDGGEARILGRPSADISWLCFLPGSARLLSLSAADGILRLWSIPAGDLLREWKRQPMKIDSSVLQRHLAAVGGPGPRLSFIRPDGQREVWSLAGNEPTRLGAVPYSDGVVDSAVARLARIEGPEGRVIRIHSLVEPGEPVRTIGSDPARIVQLAFSPEGKSIASLDERGEIRLWGLSSRRVKPPRTLSGGRIERLAYFGFDPTGSKLAVADMVRGRILVWRLASDRSDPEWSFTLKLPSNVAFDPSGDRLAAARQGSGDVYVWRLDGPPDAEPLALRQSKESFNQGLTFSPDHRWIATWGYTGMALWCMGNDPWPRVIRPDRPILKLGIAVSPDGSWVADTDLDTAGIYRMRLWPLLPGGPRRTWVTSSLPNWDYAVSADGRTLVSGSLNGKVYVVDPLGPGKPRVLEGFHSEVWSVDISRDGRWVAASGGQYIPSEGIVRVWDLETGSARVYGSGGHWITDVKFLTDDRLLEGGPAGFRLWNLQNGSFETLRKGGDWQLGYLDASPDGRWMLSSGIFTKGGFRGEIRLHDLQSGDSQPFSSHGPSAVFAKFALGGRAVVTSGSDNVIRIGLVSDGKPHLLFGHEGLPSALTTTADSKWIVSTGYDSTIRVWPMPDLDRPPLQALPLSELLAKLRHLTNQRVVPDPKSPTGYRLEIGPFSGWGSLPTW